jgi:hypothetical protein
VIAAGYESTSAHRGLAAASAGFRLPMTHSLPRRLGVLVDHLDLTIDASTRPRQPRSAHSQRNGMRVPSSTLASSVGVGWLRGRCAGLGETFV